MILRRIPLLAVLLSFPLCAAGPAAGSPAIAEALREQALAGSGAYALVESLTTEVGPRMAGTEGDARAVEWAKRTFARLGYDRVRLEPVRFPTWRRGHERAEVLGASSQPLHITALGGSIGTGGVPLEAEVVAFPSLDALVAAEPGSLSGRIAFIDRRMQRHRDGHGYGEAVGARGKGAVEAARKGAVAVLIRSIGTDRDRLPHTGIMRYEDGVPQVPAAALSNPDADQLSRLLARGPVRLRLDIDAGPGPDYTSYNVIGEITGASRPEEIVVLGAHLDSWDLGTGAIDDGAGIGITMAAGALIGRLDTPPARTIRVVAFANEEQGLLGGKAYAAAHAAELQRHVIGVESDFGAGRIHALRTVHGASPPDWVREAGAALAPLGIEWQPVGGGPGPDLIHAAQGGMPWAQLVQDGTDYFDWHHTANDTLDKIEPAALDQQVAAYAVLAWLAANGGLLGTPD